MSETGSDLLGRPTTIKSNLSENGFDFAIKWSSKTRLTRAADSPLPTKYLGRERGAKVDQL
jgi:hypothetical protein